MSTEEDKTIQAVMANDIKYIKEDVKEIKGCLESKYVTKEEFDPIKKIVYGIVGVVLMGVLGAVMALILK